MTDQKAIKNRGRAVFLATIITCSVFAGTVAFSENSVATDATPGGAVHYNNDTTGSGNFVIEIPFEDGAGIAEETVTASNFTLYDGEVNISDRVDYAQSMVSNNGDTVYLSTGDELISSRNLEVELSDDVVSSTDGQRISVAFAGQSYDTSQLIFDVNAYQGTTIAVYNTSDPPSDFTVEGTNTNFFFQLSSGTNSEVLTINTGSLELDTYQTNLGGNITLRDLGLTATVTEQSVTTTDEIDGTISANAGGREIILRLINESGETVEQTSGTLSGAGEFDFTFDAVQNEGDYTVSVTDRRSGVQASSPEVTVTSDTADLTGNGTATDPYILTSVSELQAIEQDTAAHYELGDDINATETSEWNSGRGFDPIESFSGTFDGNGHTITGLSISRSSGTAVGVFGSMGDSGRISNVALVDADVSGSTDVGGLVGDNDGTIERSYVSGSVNGTSEVGGVVGDNGGLIKESHSTAAVNGMKRVGGLVGFNNDNSTVESSYAAGPVTGDRFVGGLIGKQRIYTSSVIGSYWDTESTSQSSSAGGTGLDTAQMTGEVAEDNMPGFDFNETWRISDYYPLLRPVSDESGSLDGVRVNSPSTNVEVGSSVTTSVQVEDVDVNVGAIETTLRLTNSSVGAIESVTVSGSPDQTDISYSANNDSVSVKAYGLDLAAEDTSTIIQVTLSAETVGTTDLQVSNTTIGSTAGEDIRVRAESGATIRSVNLSAVGGFDQAPTDPDSDGKFEDINGDGEVTISDVQAIFVNIDDPVLQNNPELFDFSGNGEVNIVDVQRLFVEVT